MKWRDSLILYPCHVAECLFYLSSLRQPISAISTAATCSDTQSELEQGEVRSELSEWVSVLEDKAVGVVRRGQFLISVWSKFPFPHVSDG